MTDPVEQAKQAVTQASQQANAEVQSVGPTAVSYIKTYGLYAVAALAALVLAHFVFGVNFGVAGF